MLGAAARLRETERLREVIGERHRWRAVRGHLHELGGDLTARRATNVAEREHLVRQAARAPAGEPGRNSRLTERPPQARAPSYDPIEPSNDETRAGVRSQSSCQRAEPALTG